MNVLSPYTRNVERNKRNIINLATAKLTTHNLVPFLNFTANEHFEKCYYNNMKETFRKEYVLKKKPVILRGLAKNWNAICNWKNIKQKYGKRNMQIQFSKFGKYDMLNELGEMEYSAVSQMKLNDFWNEYVDKNVKRYDCAYITEGSSSITKKSENITLNTSNENIMYHNVLNDAIINPENHSRINEFGHDSTFQQPFFEDPDFDATQHVTKSLLWIAAGDAVASPHRDLYHNFNVCIAGEKTFYLVPPLHFKEMGDIPRMSYRLSRMDIEGKQYSRKMIASNENEPMLTRGFSNVNLKDLYQKQQLITNNKKQSCTISKAVCLPGDVLYMPYNYYHHVFSKRDECNKSIAINFWQTCLFGVDIETDNDPCNGKQLENKIISNAVMKENLKRVNEFESRAYD